MGPHRATPEPMGFPPVEEPSLAVGEGRPARTSKSEPVHHEDVAEPHGGVKIWRATRVTPSPRCKEPSRKRSGRARASPTMEMPAANGRRLRGDAQQSRAHKAP